MQDIRPRDLIFGCWILFILDREYSLLWNRYLGYWAFTTYDTLVYNIFQMFFNYPMDRKRMKSIWALFRASLPPFPYLRTKNPGSKKCIERSLEGCISLRWGREQKENDVFHGRNLQPDISTLVCNILNWRGFYFLINAFVSRRPITSKNIETSSVYFVQKSLLILGVREGRGESFSCFDRIRGTGRPESPLSNKSRGLGWRGGG